MNPKTQKLLDEIKKLCRGYQIQMNILCYEPTILFTDLRQGDDEIECMYIEDETTGG